MCACELLTGWWIDTGKLTPLLEANRLLLEKIETRIDGNVDDASTIDGRVVVEAGRRDRQLDDPRPGGDRRRHPGRRQLHRPVQAIGAGCEIVNSEVEHSVVMDDSQIIDIPRLEDSLIGREAVVVRVPSAGPGPLRLMVGDHCQIDVE